MFSRLEAIFVFSNIFFMKFRIVSFFILSSLLFLPSFLPLQAQRPAGSEVQLVNPIGGSARDGGNKQGSVNIKLIVGNAIQVLLGIVGSITLVTFVYGGFLWLTSAGNSEKVQSGTNTLLYSTIGLFIIFGAYAILNTILKGLAK